MPEGHHHAIHAVHCPDKSTYCQERDADEEKESDKAKPQKTAFALMVSAMMREMPPSSPSFFF